MSTAKWSFCFKNFENNKGVSSFGRRTAKLSALALVATLMANAGVVAGYYDGENADSVPPKNLVTNGSAAELTHLIYAFATIQKNSNNTYSCSLSGNLNTAENEYNNAGAYYAIQEEYSAARSVSGVADTQPAPDPYIGPNDPGYSSQPKPPTVLQGGFHQLQELRAKYPNLKVLISIGGETGSADFSSAASSANVNGFVQSCVSMFIDGNYGLSKAYPGIFDGIDIDWEYPASSTDKTNYTALLKAFNSALETAGKTNDKTYILTATMGADNGASGTEYIDVPAAAEYLTYVNVMSYDDEAGGGGTGFDAPLYASPINAGSSFNISDSPWFTYNVSATFTANTANETGYIPQFKAAGIPITKLLMGLPFYGLQYDQVTDSAYHGMFETGTFLGPISYAQIVQSYLGQAQYTQYCDYGSSASPYECSPDSNSGSQETWVYDGSNNLIAFDNETSMTEKVKFAKTEGLGGVMIWDLSQDSPGACLMDAVYTTMTGDKAVNQDTALYNFESGVQGWTASSGVKVRDSEGEAFAGCKSLSVGFTKSDFVASADAYVLSPTGIKPGQTITFRIWIPTGAEVSSVNPFITNTSWTWLASDYKTSSQLTAGQWNTFSFVVPTNAPTSFGELGVEIASSAAWTGQIYIDSITN